MIVAILGWSVFVTFALKDGRYGSTPAFASAALLFDEIRLKAWYTLEGAMWRSSQFASAIVSQGFGRDEEKREARAIPVLTYHRVVNDADDLNNITTARFKDQMTTLKRAGWETITLKEYQEYMAGTRELPERSFLITFDDGAKQSFYPVDPLFAALEYEGVIYIIANSMYTPESTYYLSPNEIKRMLATGRWEIGSHSFDGHRPYSADAAGSEAIFFADKLWLEDKNRVETEEEFTSRVRKDLQQAKETLEREYSVKIDTFAFPLGNETGIAGAANFPEGASITEREALAIYSLGFLQTNNTTFSFNYPGEKSKIARRIHVDYDWDGKRLLQELEQGLPKDLPFSDDFSEDRGWLPAWGTLDLGRNNFSLTAENQSSSASAFLDGSKLWEDYSFESSLNWNDGSVFLLADVQAAKTYTACAFSQGVVRIQSTKDGETRTLAERRDPRIQPHDNAKLGIRVRGSVVECLWDYESIVEAYERTGQGGIGIQVWNSSLGRASIQVSEVLVRPLER